MSDLSDLNDRFDQLIKNVTRLAVIVERVVKQVETLTLKEVKRNDAKPVQRA